MNNKIKTYLSIPLLFVIVALLWSIAGNALFDLPKLKKEKVDNEIIVSLINIICTNDFDRSVKFYSDIVGFSIIKNVKDCSGIHKAVLKLGSIELQIHSNRKDMQEDKTILDENVESKIRLLFKVKNIRLIYERIKETGTNLNDKNNLVDDKLAFEITDPDGNIISFFEDEN